MSWVSYTSSSEHTSNHCCWHKTATSLGRLPQLQGMDSAAMNRTCCRQQHPSSVPCLCNDFRHDLCLAQLCIRHKLCLAGALQCIINMTSRTHCIQQISCGVTIMCYYYEQNAANTEETTFLLPCCHAWQKVTLYTAHGPHRDSSALALAI